MNVTLICGGKSGEHHVSVQSAKNIYSALVEAAYSVNLVYIEQNGTWLHIAEAAQFLESSTYQKINVPAEARKVILAPGSKDPFQTDSDIIKTDVVFPIVHGPGGEDGTLQGLLELLEVPYVGPKVLSSAVCMDKVICKIILESAGLKTAPYKVVTSTEDLEVDLTYPLFVKPANLGSSVGISKVGKPTELKSAVELALKYDKIVLIEEGIKGKEVECAVLGNSDPVSTGAAQIVAPDEFYSYDAKYIDGSTKIVMPAPISEKETRLLKETALKTYRACRCEGLARVDMFLTDGGEVYVNEPNTLPGFTKISMYPQLWAHEGVAYKNLVKKLVELAIE